MTQETLAQLELIERYLNEGYRGKLLGLQRLTAGSMRNAYATGVRDVIRELGRTYELTLKPAVSEALTAKVSASE